MLSLAIALISSSLARDNSCRYAWRGALALGVAEGWVRALAAAAVSARPLIRVRLDACRYLLICTANRWLHSRPHKVGSSIHGRFEVKSFSIRKNSAVNQRHQAGVI